MFQALSTHLAKSLARRHPELLPAAAATFRPDNVVSIRHAIQFADARGLRSLLQHGVKSFKQQYVCASIPELSGRLIVGVDDLVSSLHEDGVRSANYEPDHVHQVIRIPVQPKSAAAASGPTSRSQPMPSSSSSEEAAAEASWRRVTDALVDVHARVATQGLLVREAVAIVQQQILLPQ